MRRSLSRCLFRRQAAALFYTYLSAIACDSVVIFIFYQTEPWAAFELQLLDPRFYDQLNPVGDIDLDDVELVISHDALDHPIRAFAFSDPRGRAEVGEISR